MAKRTSITGELCVLALKGLGHSSRAKTVAGYITSVLGVPTDSRAVATALRVPVSDGRVSCSYRRNTGVASYRFVRLKAKAVRP